MKRNKKIHTHTIVKLFCFLSQKKVFYGRVREREREGEYILRGDILKKKRIKKYTHIFY